MEKMVLRQKHPSFDDGTVGRVGVDEFLIGLNWKLILCYQTYLMMVLTITKILMLISVKMTITMMKIVTKRMFYFVEAALASCGV